MWMGTTTRETVALSGHIDMSMMPAHCALTDGMFRLDRNRLRRHSGRPSVCPFRLEAAKVRSRQGVLPPLAVWRGSSQALPQDVWRMPRPSTSCTRQPRARTLCTAPHTAHGAPRTPAHASAPAHMQRMQCAHAHASMHPIHTSKSRDEVRIIKIFFCVMFIFMFSPHLFFHYRIFENSL